MFCLLSKCRRLKLPIDLQLKLFDSVVQPILTYGSEVWGPYGINVVEKLQLRFLKLILGLKRCTPTVMVRGETGCFPISCEVESRILNYWFKLVINNRPGKIANIMYNCMYKMYQLNSFTCKWIDHVRKSLDQLGLSYIFDTQAAGVSEAWFRSVIKQRLHDKYVQEWSSSVNVSDSCICYRMFKSDFKFEDYLTRLPYNMAISLLKFRSRNVLIPAVKNHLARYPTELKCYFCDDTNPDEFHYMFVCPKFRVDRLKIRPNTFFHNHVNIFKYQSLMTDSKYSQKIALFTKTVDLVIKDFLRNPSSQ